jgi:hypothetical protein
LSVISQDVLPVDPDRDLEPRRASPVRDFEPAVSQGEPMKKLVTTLALLAISTSAFAANSVRISQVYGGGGGSTGTYLFDYVELFNASGSAVNIGGWSIQYGSATGTSFGSSAGNMAILPQGASIAPCSYYLVQVGAAGTGGVALPVTPDFINAGGPAMSATTGKVALINNSVGANACSGNTVGGIYVDVVGYGTGNCFEGAAAPGTTSTQADVRNGGGLNDTDANNNDFTLVTNPVPRNSQSPANTQCLATPATSGSWGAVKSLYR